MAQGNDANKGFLKSLFDFYLYGNLHIAGCAALFTAYTFTFFGLELNMTYVIFVFFSTVLLYSIHRIIGIDKVANFRDKGRFAIIRSFRKGLILTSLITAILSIVFFFKLEVGYMVLLFYPAIVSLIYVLPVFPGKRRFRDFPLIKIFLVAIVWSYIVCFIPIVNLTPIDYDGVFYFISRVLFVFAITIPFDIRDFSVDKETNVNTLVNTLGIRYSKILAVFVLLISFVLILKILLGKQYSSSFLLPEILTYLITCLLILFSHEKRSDVYFTFLLDGTMMLFISLYFFLEY